MNRITVRRLLDIQCEQNRSHDIDVEGPIGIFEKKRNRILSFLSYFFCLVFLVNPARFHVRGKKT